MPSNESEQVICPGCGQGYRWQASLIGKTTSCKQCGQSFEVPMQPGQGILPKPADQDVYELAADPDAEPDLPPAFELAKSPPSEAQAAAPATPGIEPPSAEVEPDSDQDRGQQDPADPEVHVSEATKAARREQQRIAAAANTPEPKWWQHKWVIIAVALLVLLGIIYWAMHAFSDAMEDGLHNSTLINHVELFAASEPTHTRNAS